jgi:hypothetical protein
MTIANPKTPKPHTLSPWGREERRRVRQEEAEARKAERAKRTPEEQLAVLEARGITRGREYDRLLAIVTGKDFIEDDQRRRARREKFKKVA